MKPLFLALLAAASSVVGQSVIDYSKIPDCARQCAVLSQAEQSCLPPAAPATDQGTYQSCVCQSGLLTQLHASGLQCQQTGCSVEDASKISQYYASLCAGPVVQPAGTTTTSASTKTTGTATAKTGTSTLGAVDNKGVSDENPDEKGWFANHWKWVVMLIVVFVGIIVIWVGGFLLRRHYTRKHDAERANLAAKDAPFNPSGSGHRSNRLSRSEMAMSGGQNGMAMPGGQNGMAMDGGVGGIAPPRGPSRSRSRSNTLQSLGGMASSSRTNLPPQPVAWGPHQHQAHLNNSPGSSVPPSPTSAISPPHPVYRNREAMRSEPRHAQYRSGPADSTNYSLAVAEEVERPRTTTGDEPIQRDVNRHTLRGNEPMMSPQFEPQSAEICETSPNKLQKHR